VDILAALFSPLMCDGTLSFAYLGSGACEPIKASGKLAKLAKLVFESAAKAIGEEQVFKMVHTFTTLISSSLSLLSSSSLSLSSSSSSSSLSYHPGHPHHSLYQVNKADLDLCSLSKGEDLAYLKVFTLSSPLPLSLSSPSCIVHRQLPCGANNATYAHPLAPLQDLPFMML
jgi:hypothetical protein